AREQLIALGAERLARPASELELASGQVQPKTGGSGVALGDLIGGRRLSLKDPATYSLVGKPLPRPDIPGKCAGTETFVHDFKLPGMLHGRVIRPPRMGATLLAVDEASIVAIPDVRVVRIKD